MAMSLIDQLTEHFEPESYQDTYRQELDLMIKQKIKGQKPKPKGEVPHPSKSTDLMMLLKESLAKAKQDQRVAQA
jgi:DNA end-binding protein Ku